MNDIGKYLMIAGCILIGTGILFSLFAKIPGFDKMPGDVVIKKEGFTFYFPWVTCLLVSAILTLIMYFLRQK